MPLIELSKIAVTIQGREILHDVNMSMNAGEIVTLIGPNGAGKSSLVRTMIGVISPSKGKVVRAPNLRIGYVPQTLETTRSMPMNVGRFLGGAGCAKREKRDAIVEKYGIANLVSKPLAVLSGGEMRRVLFAHALMDEPNLLILDEPTAGLDISATARFYEFIEDLRVKENLAILLVSHDLNVVMRASDRVICLNGHICCEGTPKDVSEAPEYAAMIGIAEPVALYEHHHDHTHEH